MSFCVVSLHSRLTSTYPFTNRVRGAASKALAGIGGEHTAGAGDTGPLGWRDVHKTSGVKHLLESRTDCLCAKRNGTGLHNVPVELKTS